MLRSIIISPDLELAESLVGALEGQRVGILRRVSRYPNMVDLVRLLRAVAPQVVFLSVESRPDAVDIAARIEAQAPGTHVVAVNRTCDPPTLLETMRAGIREFLAPPVDGRAQAEMIFRISEQVEQRPPLIESSDSVCAFLPAKPGVGASTVALNVSLALAEQPDYNVLLADFDLNCGMLGFMLKLNPSRSIVDAAENALHMDEKLWPKLVSSIGNLDLLPAGRPNPGFRIDPAQIRHMIEFARRNYKAVCVDLSGLMEKFSIELLHEAKRIFLVVTPEIPSLHLARERLSYLRQLDLESRVSIVVNRASQRHDSSRAEIEKLFGMPIFMSLPNDYAGVQKALTAGEGIARASELGRRFKQFAHLILGKPSDLGEPKRRLLDLVVPRKKPALAS